MPIELEDQLPTRPGDPFAAIGDPSAAPEELSYGDMVYNLLSAFLFPSTPEESTLRPYGQVEERPWLHLDDPDKYSTVESNLSESVQSVVSPEILKYSTKEDKHGNPMIGEGSYWDEIYWEWELNPEAALKEYGAAAEEGDEIYLKGNFLFGSEPTDLIIEDWSVTAWEQHLADVATGLIGVDTYRIEESKFPTGYTQGPYWQKGFGMTGQADIQEAMIREKPMRINYTCLDAACDIYNEADIPWPIDPDTGKTISHIETLIDVLDGRKFVKENKDIIKGYEKMESIEDIKKGSIIFVGTTAEHEAVKKTNPIHTVVVTKITDKGIEVVDDSGDNSAKKKDFHYWESLTNFKRSYHAFVAGYNYVKPTEEGSP